MMTKPKITDSISIRMKRIDRNMNHMKKNLILSAIGVGLQTAGGICLFAVALGIGKEINQQIKKTIIKELSKQVAED